MTVDYAPSGLFGVLTPQANTTVEPEVAILTPPDYAWINGRLTSAQNTIEARLVDYFTHLGPSFDQFANAPLKAVAVACTGASYLVGVAEEDRVLAALPLPTVTAARAVVDGLQVLGAQRIALVSPYHAALDTVAVAYWQARGFEVVALASAYRPSDAFHPIYSLDRHAAEHALASLSGVAVDAVVMLGTGMPTLHAIRAAPRLGHAPVLSCMLALVWRTIALVDQRAPAADDLLSWIDGAAWAGSARLDVHTRAKRANRS
jgi:maleate isomerase